MKLVLFETKRDYRYLWLKYVGGTRLSVHCAACLTGHYDRHFRPHVTRVEPFEFGESPFYYLCGVAADRKWAHNLHVAWTAAYGQTLEVDDEFCHLIVSDARRLMISPGYIDRNLPQAARAEFSTCRNWQFANMIARGLAPSYVPPKPKYKDLNLFDEETFY